MNKNLNKLIKYLESKGYSKKANHINCLILNKYAAVVIPDEAIELLEEGDYIDNLIKFKDKKEWSVDHNKILELAKNEAPSSKYIAPIETIHQINAILLQFKEELKSKLLRMIGKHNRRDEMDIEMVQNTFENLVNTIDSIDSAISLNRKETKNIK